MVKARYAIGLTMILAGYASGALAAEKPSAILQQPKGQVFVGQAKTMVPARPGMPLYAGNRVVVAAGGAAKVAYIGGCTVALPENSLLAVGGAGQCKAGLATVRATGGFKNAHIGQVPKQQSDNDDPKFGDGAGPWIVGGALGIGLIAAISSDNNSDNPPASP